MVAKFGDTLKSSVIRQKGESHTSEGKKCSFFGTFGVLCFLETPVLRFALLPYNRWNVESGFLCLWCKFYNLVTLEKQNKTALLTVSCSFYYTYFYSFRCVFMIFKLMQSDFMDCTYASLFIWKLRKAQVSGIIFWRSFR